MLDRDDIEVTCDVVVKPGIYRVIDANGDGVLRIRKAGVTVDFAGATLLGSAEDTAPDAFDGIGIAIEDAAGVAIKGANIHGFRVGIRAVRCPGLLVASCDVGEQRRMHLRSTPEREDEADWLWPHENDAGEWGKRYGAGIEATECDGARFTGNRARASQNGLLLERSKECRVHDNDFSFLSGWGLALWRASGNEIAHNRFDWCVRGYSHGVYARGQDSAGILVFEQCARNVFAHNSATHGGDGFFLYAGHETVERTGRGGCDGNLLYGNDFSYAVANGIEATFSRGNVFAHNRVDDCAQHGIWAGFSYETVIVGNHIEGALGGGISIEHGHDNWIEANTLAGNRAAIELWANETTPFAQKAFGRGRDLASTRTTIVRNDFAGNERSIDVRRSSRIAVLANAFAGERRVLRAREPCEDLAFEGNVLDARDAAPEWWIRNETGRALRAGTNAWGPGDRAALLGPDVAAGPALDPKIERGAIERDVAAPRVGGTLDAMLPATALRGRQWIAIGAWGPLDPSEPQLLPAEVSAFGAATVSVLGPPGEFAVTRATPGIDVAPRSGTTPGALELRLAGEAARAQVFAVEVRVPGAASPLVARGTLARAPWRVRFYSWHTGAPETPPRDWSSVIAGAPLEERTTDRLDFAWGGDAPAPRVPADGFATVAETELALPAGRCEIHTVSDDGVRVLLDGKVVQQDWSWHPPKENVTVVDVQAGEHALRVEHFEIDGGACLRFWLRLLPSR